MIWVYNNYKQDFEIASVTSKNNYFKVLKQDKVTDGYQLNMEITPPPATEGSSGFSDELYIQIKDGEKLTVNCNGYYDISQIPKSGNTKK